MNVRQARRGGEPVQDKVRKWQGEEGKTQDIVLPSPPWPGAMSPVKVHTLTPEERLPLLPGHKTY